MAIKNGKIPPTITLAQLYEAQQQYFDAFIIYKKLNEQNPSEEMLDRMNRSKNRIFMDTNVIYNELISKIFNDEDKELFKILPDTNYQNYLNSQKNDVEEVEFVEEDFEENEYDMSEAEEIEQIYNPTDLPSFEDFTAEMKATQEMQPEESFNLESSLNNRSNGMDIAINNMTVSDLGKLLMSEIGGDRRVKDITLQEIFSIIEMIKKVH